MMQSENCGDNQQTSCNHATVRPKKKLSDNLQFPNPWFLFLLQLETFLFRSSKIKISRQYSWCLYTFCVSNDSLHEYRSKTSYIRTRRYVMWRTGCTAVSQSKLLQTSHCLTAFFIDCAIDFQPHQYLSYSGTWTHAQLYCYALLKNVLRCMLLSTTWFFLLFTPKSTFDKVNRKIVQAQSHEHPRMWNRKILYFEMQIPRILGSL